MTETTRSWKTHFWGKTHLFFSSSFTGDAGKLDVCQQETGKNTSHFWLSDVICAALPLRILSLVPTTALCNRRSYGSWPGTKLRPVLPGLYDRLWNQFNAANGVHVHDFQATLLHLLGIDHLRLTYKHQGRRYRLTDVHGEVVEPLLD